MPTRSLGLGRGKDPGGTIRLLCTYTIPTPLTILDTSVLTNLLGISLQ